MKRLVLVTICTLLIFCSTAFAKGPTGFGHLQLGMTKADVEAISHESLVYLASPLVPFESENYKPVAGVDIFNADVQSPFDRDPLTATLKFSDDKLIYIMISFDDDSSIFNKAKGMITEKYGEPKINDAMDEKRCTYRNGAVFKIGDGHIKYSWLAADPHSESVETMLFVKNVGICPNPRLGIEEFKSKYMIIEYADADSTKSANVF